MKQQARRVSSNSARAAETAMAAQLAQFRALPQKHLYVATARWDYISRGSGPQALTILTGGDAIGEAWFRHILEFESEYRIIAVSYPPVSKMELLIEGLDQILQAEGISHTNVLGYSFGGMLAQCFVRRHPNKVSRLILANTTYPSRAYAGHARRNLMLLTVLPWALIQRAALTRLLKLLAPPAQERDFWWSYFDQQFSDRIDKKLLLSLERCMLDFSLNYRFKPGDLAGGQVLIVESDTDPFFKDRVILKALYPNAKVHTFLGAGHVPAFSRRDQFNSVVRSFLQKGPATAKAHGRQDR